MGSEMCIRDSINAATNRFCKLSIDVLWDMADNSDAVDKDYVPPTKKTGATPKRATIATATWQSASESDTENEEGDNEHIYTMDYRPQHRPRRPWTGSKPRQYTSRAPKKPTYTNMLEMLHPLIDQAISRKRTHSEAMDEDPTKDTHAEQNSNPAILELSLIHI